MKWFIIKLLKFTIKSNGVNRLGITLIDFILLLIIVLLLQVKVINLADEGIDVVNVIEVHDEAVWGGVIFFGADPAGYRPVQSTVEVVDSVTMSLAVADLELWDIEIKGLLLGRLLRPELQQQLRRHEVEVLLGLLVAVACGLEVA